MTTLPQVPVINSADGKKTSTQIPTPAIFSVPLRNDIVYDVYKGISKNRRQAHGVTPSQGHRHSAESWGTGRAVARIPRVGGSGTHRSGQAAFGNMCRKGRMFAPLHVWRRWNRKVNLKQKRQAIGVALAASAILPLVQARGHLVADIASLPLVIDNTIEQIENTKEVVALLKRIGAYADIKKVGQTKNLKAGKGKLRGRRYRQRKGPLIIYNTENCNLLKGVRNIPGVEICHVSRLNLLQLAPGGQIGRFIIWTADAFKALNSIFGTYKNSVKKGFVLNRPIMTNADLARIINSNEIQTACNDKKQIQTQHSSQKHNPLSNNTALFKLNPAAKTQKAQAAKQQEESIKNRKALLANKRKEHNAHKKGSQAWINNFHKTVVKADQEAKQEEKDWIAQGQLE